MVKAVMSMILLAVSSSRPTHVKPLPSRARITIEQAHWRSTPEPGQQCPAGPALTEREVRRMFITYHVLRGEEYHDNYAQTNCLTEGSIQVDGKTFRFIAEPINNLYTNWPDGKGRILGGRHSDESDSQ